MTSLNKSGFQIDFSYKGYDVICFEENPIVNVEITLTLNRDSVVIHSFSHWGGDDVILRRTLQFVCSQLWETGADNYEGVFYD